MLDFATVQLSVLTLNVWALPLGLADDEETRIQAIAKRFPEFDADVMRSYVELRADVLREEGLDPDRFARETRDSSDGPAVLRRFGDIVRGS